tara:strand:- start:408 stop:518 length:111 start_codon:yes stop_codon:yes gene_type:complete
LLLVEEVELLEELAEVELEDLELHVVYLLMVIQVIQ